MDIADIKKELSSDEKVLESAFKLETIYKKHKVKIWLLIIVLVLSFFTKIIIDKIESDKLLVANSALISLQQDASNTEALETLKANNPKLYDLYLYSAAVKDENKDVLHELQNSENGIVADASKYSLEALESKLTDDSKLYNEFALLSGAYSSIRNGELEMAKSKLELIDDRSPLGTVASYLMHATIKGQ